MFWIVDEVPGGWPLDVLAVLVLTAGRASQSGEKAARDLKKHGWWGGAKPIKTVVRKSRSRAEENGHKHRAMVYRCDSDCCVAYMNNIYEGAMFIRYEGPTKEAHQHLLQQRHTSSKQKIQRITSCCWQ